ncbi:MAG: GyrI-like domain-containing protein, partial [Aldersonia sp.]|nr:GyrI-like domain-containing protein [Aldersonia sp.]
ENVMLTDDVVVKSLPAVRVAELSGKAADYQSGSIGPVISALFGDLHARLQTAGVPITGPAIAVYEDSPDGDGTVIVRATAPVNVDPSDDFDFTVRDLPAVERAATVVHHGSMDQVDVVWQALGRWIDTNGERTSGGAREQTLEYTEDPAGWVTELQFPLR